MLLNRNDRAKWPWPQSNRMTRCAGQQRRQAAERILNQDEIDSLLGFGPAKKTQDTHRHPRHHQFGAGVLRTPADAGNRLRPARPADDDVAAQLHLRQRRSQPRQHHLDPFRRLSQFDPASGRCSRSSSAEELGQLRPLHGRFQPDLFDRRRAPRRTPRHRGDAHRGPALHDDRAHAGAAHDRSDPGRSSGRPSSR